jgi:hypothetical protein
MASRTPLVLVSGQLQQLQAGDTLPASTVGLGNVTNDAQTKAAVVPNTLPGSGQILVGNAGGTAYAPVTVSGSGATITMGATGVLTISGIANASLTNSSITVSAGFGLTGGGSVALGSSMTLKMGSNPYAAEMTALAGAL